MKKIMHPTVDPATFFLDVYARMSSPLLQNPSVCPCGHWQAQQCIQAPLRHRAAVVWLDESQGRFFFLFLLLFFFFAGTGGGGGDAPPPPPGSATVVGWGALCLNVDKTKAMFSPPATRLIPADIAIECLNIPLSTVSSYKYLRFIIHSALTWNAHIDSVVRKVSKKIGALKRAGNAMTRDTRRKYYLAVVQSDLQYGLNAFWTSLSNARKNSLIHASKRDLRAVVDGPTTTSTSSILSLLTIERPRVYPTGRIAGQSKVRLSWESAVH